MGVIKRTFIILLILCVFGSIAFKAYEYNFYLRYALHEFGVWHISYLKHDSWGFIRAKSSGVVVYELPDDVSKAIQEQGVQYLKNLPSSSGDIWENRAFAQWLPTPIEVTKYWVDYMSMNEKNDYSKETPALSSYLNAFGFGVSVRQDIEALADNAIRTKGSYYAYMSHGSVMIVIPAARKLIFAYRG